jgi:hypothetical protein
MPLYYLPGNRFEAVDPDDERQPHSFIQYVGRGPTSEILMHYSFIRRVLAVDAVASGAMGLGLAAFAPWLAAWLGLPVELLRESGLILLPWAAFVGFLASRQQPPRIGVWTVIAINSLWVIDSIVLLVSGWVEPTALGFAFVIAQAVIVGVLAELEVVGLRRVQPGRAREA